MLAVLHLAVIQVVAVMHVFRDAIGGGSNDPTPLIHVNTDLLAFAAGAAVPLVVAVFTKLHASSKTKAVLKVVLSIVGGVIAALLASDTPGTLSVLQILDVCVKTYLGGVATYHSLWKPTGATAKIAAKTANVGFG
jgi:hypothetical protein